MKVVALVVAYNRQSQLATALDALAAQSQPPAAVLVVDNASTDQSAQVAKDHPVGAEVVVLPRNTGGAGGFAAGLAHATKALAADAVWLMDDDTVPTPTALEELLKTWQAYPGQLTLAGSRVVWTDGRDHPMNTPRSRLLAGPKRWHRASAVGARPIRTGSFVGLLVAAGAVQRLGLPRAEYFIWNDDFEYSARLLRHGEGVLVPDSVVEHHTARPAGALDNPGDRFFYEVRNKVWTFAWAGVFGPVDTIAYVAYTGYGWVKALVRATDKAAMVRLLGKGLWAGLRRPPRPTRFVLSGLGPISQTVQAVETRARR